MAEMSTLYVWDIGAFGRHTLWVDAGGIMGEVVGGCMESMCVLRGIPSCAHSTTMATLQILDEISQSGMLGENRTTM